MELIDLIYGARGWLLIVFVVSFFTAMGFVSYLMRWVRSRRPAAGLKARAVLTPNEQEFFGRLKRALPDYDVLAQVGMGALLTTTVEENHPSFWALRNQFSQKIADFVVMRGNKVIAVIELDDRTHNKDKDAQRDAMLDSVGLCTLRFESRAKPSEAEIRRQVTALDRSRDR
jgi:hypothetical protein